ncbi:MAG: WG repeat-containing protein [Bacteroidales bacterium]|nr:WG repeat-containing protein [Bacteroidales bacterium]MCF8336401.1 WG repeat-containing protein [Bacteroidales bacterium]
MSKEGNEILSCSYKKIFEMDKGLFKVQAQNKKWGVFNNGQLIIDSKYKKIELNDDGSILARRKGVSYYFEKNGNEIF